MLTPCPSCQTPIVTADSLAGVRLDLQIPGKGWDSRNLGGFVIENGVAMHKQKPAEGETLYVPHRPLCRMAG